MIVMGNPGVTARDPYPTHGNPYPSTQVGVFTGRGRGLAVFFYYYYGLQVHTITVIIKSFIYFFLSNSTTKFSILMFL